MVRRRKKRRKPASEYVVPAIIFGIVFLFIFAAVTSVYKIWKLESELKRIEREEIENLSERLKRLEKLLGPDSPLSEYIVDLNYVSNVLKDLKILEKALADRNDDVRSAYFRVLIIGEEKVWISIGKGGKTYFAQNSLPGLLPYKFYYFKPPSLDLDYIKVVPKDVSVTVGKPNRVFLIFFGVGTGAKRPVKIVKLTRTHYNSLKDDFHLTIPE